jgi:hypothetical protein
MNTILFQKQSIKVFKFGKIYFILSKYSLFIYNFTKYKTTQYRPKKRQLSFKTKILML